MSWYTDVRDKVTGNAGVILNPSAWIATQGGDSNPVNQSLDKAENILAPPEPPTPPDFTKLAEATAWGDLMNAQYATEANRPDMVNPFGSSVWTQGVDEYGNKTNDWSNKVTLSPEQQAIFDAQQKNQLGTLDLASSGLDQMQGIFNTPFNTADYGSRATYQAPGGEVPTYQGMTDPLDTYAENREKVREAMLARVDQDITVDRDNLHSSLIAKGIPEGSLAYQNAMREVDRKQTDARQQAEIKATEMANMDYNAMLAGRQQGVSELKDQFGNDLISRNQRRDESMDLYNTGNQDYRTDVQDALLNRQTPLNEYSAFSSGTQVTNPTFQPFANQQTTSGADYLGAGMAQSNYDLGIYNAQQAANNATTSGLFDLGAAYVGAKA